MEPPNTADAAVVELLEDVRVALSGSSDGREPLTDAMTQAIGDHLISLVVARDPFVQLLRQLVAGAAVEGMVFDEALFEAAVEYTV